MIFLEPKHGCGSPPRCHILFIDWVGQGTLYSLDLPQTDKNLRAARADPNSFEVCRVAREIQQMLNPGYPWIFGELVVSLQRLNARRYGNNSSNTTDSIRHPGHRSHGETNGNLCYRTLQPPKPSQSSEKVADRLL